MKEAVESIGRAMQDALRASVSSEVDEKFREYMMRGRVTMPHSMSMGGMTGKLVMKDGREIAVGEVEIHAVTAEMHGDDGIISRASRPSGITIHAAGDFTGVERRLDVKDDMEKIREELHQGLYDALEEVEKSWAETKGKVAAVESLREQVSELIFENNILKTDLNRLKTENDANISRLSILEHEMWENRKTFNSIFESLREMKSVVSPRGGSYGVSSATIKLDR